jgi:phage/plasmid primase-like uncharacterized protein
MEIQGRRPIGDPRNLERDPEKVRDAIIENMARNLSRQDEKQLGTDLVEQAVEIRRGGIHGMQAAWHREEVAAAAQQPAPVATVQQATQQRSAAIRATTTTRRQPGESAPRQPAQPRHRPNTQKAPVMSETEAQAAFADALQGAGLRLKGPPTMDGKMHRAQVDGDRGKKMSGSYVGYLDGRPAGYIHNFKTGEEIRWRAAGGARRLSPQERAAISEAQKAAQADRARERAAQQEKVSAAAQRAWDGAKPASASHPYLIAKGVRPHGLREGQPGQTVPMTDGRRMSINGRLLVPMKDGEGGKLWNLQMIDRKGGKVFMPGRKQGLFTTLGPVADGSPLVIGEGFTTSATLRETTALTSVVAFDSGNLMPVAMELRAKHPDRPIIFAADNDHHLPRRSPPLPNVGLEKANEAAAAVGATVLVPAFEPHDRGSDWNDYRAKHGHQAARDAMKDHFQQNGIPMPEAAPTPAAKPVTQADRDAARATASSRRSHGPRPAQRPPEQEQQGQQRGPRQ